MSSKSLASGPAKRYVPAYCAGFDVGLIPFVLNELTRNVNPIKLREYLSAGLPVVSSAIPYTLDLLALRRLSTAVFGVLTSLNPAVAALAGLVVLHELPPRRQLVGIALVMVASAGVTLSGRVRGSRRTQGPSPRKARETAMKAS